MLNVAIKLIAGIKCICALRVCTNHIQGSEANAEVVSSETEGEENIKRNVTGCGIIRQRTKLSTSRATYTQN